MSAIEAFGSFEIAPRKGYVSLRRKKQFAMIGPGTNTRVDVGLNMKDLPGTERLKALPAGGMCQYQVRVTNAAEVNPELIAWVRRAYEAAGQSGAWVADRPDQLGMWQECRKCRQRCQTVRSGFPSMTLLQQAFFSATATR